MENVRWDLVEEWSTHYRNTMHWLEHDLPFIYRNRRTLKDRMDRLWDEMNDSERRLARRLTLGIENRALLAKRLEWLDEELARDEEEGEEEERLTASTEAPPDEEPFSDDSSSSAGREEPQQIPARANVPYFFNRRLRQNVGIAPP